MSISSITSLSSASSAYQQPIDSEYMRIQAYLVQHGCVPSGNKAADEQTYNTMQAKEMAMRSQDGDGSKKTKGADKSSDSSAAQPPYADFMSQLGLTPTGDPDDDEAATIAEIQQRINSAADPSERAYYQGLLGQVDDEFNQSASSSAGGSVMSAMDAYQSIGNLNRFLLLNSAA